jgi:hypothetical protein
MIKRLWIFVFYKQYFVSFKCVVKNSLLALLDPLYFCLFRIPEKKLQAPDICPYKIRAVHNSRSYVLINQTRIKVDGF